MRAHTTLLAQRTPKRFTSRRSYSAKAADHAPSSSSSSLDPSSIAHFSRLSQQWWSPTGETALLHAMNPIRIRFIKDKLAEVRAWDDSLRAADGSASNAAQHAAPDGSHDWSWLQGQDCLDVGCGAGLLTEVSGRAANRCSIASQLTDQRDRLCERHLVVVARFSQGARYRRFC